MVSDGVPADKCGFFIYIDAGLGDVCVIRGQNRITPPMGFDGAHYLVFCKELKSDGRGKERISVEGVNANVEDIVLAAGEAVEVACTGDVGMKCPKVETSNDLLQVPRRGLLGNGACGQGQRSQTIATTAKVTSVTQLDVPTSCGIAFQ